MFLLLVSVTGIVINSGYIDEAWVRDHRRTAETVRAGNENLFSKSNFENQEDVLGAKHEIFSIFESYKKSSHDMLRGYRFLTTPARKFKDVTHCIFDLDGTVLDSEVIYHKIIHKICKNYNRKYPEEIQNKVYGGTDRQMCETVQRELKLPISVNELEKQLNDQTKKYLPSAPLQPGAERLLTHLHDHKIPLALATNSTEQAVRLHSLARPKLFGLFHHKVSVTDPEVDRGKPNPDIFFVAAARFSEKPKPKDCLVFEDSVVGVQAANEAGMQVVMTPDRRLQREQTRHATLVLRSFLDFKPELFGLPPFPPPKEDIKAPPRAYRHTGTSSSSSSSSNSSAGLGNPHNANVSFDDRRRVIYKVYHK